MPAGKGGKGSSGRTVRPGVGNKSLRPEGAAKKAAAKKSLYNAKGQMKEVAKKSLYNAKGQLKERPKKRAR